jgi:hypothetical protein
MRSDVTLVILPVAIVGFTVSSFNAMCLDREPAFDIWERADSIPKAVVFLIAVFVC